MKRNKKGFTLSEVLVAIAIIGVVMALSVQSLKVLRASYTSLTYFALKNVKNIVQEASNGTDTMHGDFLNTTTFCRQNGKITAILNPDKDIPINSIQNSCDARQMIGPDNAHFCRYVASIMNLAEEANCDYSELFNVSISKTNEPFIVTDELGKFEGVSPTLLTTNGQRYYLSKHTFNDVVSSHYGFRLLAVDLNGKSKPNISDVAHSNKVPDIVTFLILDNGEIFPLGVAADNIELTDGRIVQYINAKIKGYYYDGAYYDGDIKEIQRNRGDIPEACYATIKNSDETQNQLCNFATVYLKNINRGDGSGTFFSYRQAYCGALGDNTPSYSDYCSGVRKLEPQLCPQSDNPQKFDLCSLETVKPAFRYEMK